MDRWFGMRRTRTLHASPLRRIRTALGVRWHDLRKGRWPYPWFYLTRRWLSRKPVTFTEKLHYKLTRDRRSILHTFADKVAVRDYVAARVGKEFLTHAYAIVADPDQLDPGTLPREYFCKPSHSYHHGLMISESVDPSAALPEAGVPGLHAIHPDSLNWDSAKRLMNGWLRHRHGWGPGSGYEWAYRGLRPQLLCEELLRGQDGDPPPDYKCMVLNGRCRTISYCVRWREGHHVPYQYATLSREWDLLWQGDPKLPCIPPAPSCLERMIWCAEQLGQETDLVRVDLYVLGDRIVVGELTNYPGGGGQPYGDPDAERQLGQWWTVPRRYRDPLRYASG